MPSAVDSPRSRNTLASFIFLSRWLQAPLYLGLIVAQTVYVYRFLLELWHLIGFALLNHPAPRSTPVGVVDPETIVMLSVLGLALAWIDRLTFRTEDPKH